MRTYSKRVAVATALVAGATATSAVAAPPPPNGSFRGQTDQNIEDNTVSLLTNANGRVSEFDLAWRAKCERKKQFWTTATGISPDGDGLAMEGDVFRSAGSYTSKASKRIRGKISISMRGSFSDETSASGIWSAKVKVFKKNKRGKFKRFDTCTTGQLEWRVTRAP